MMSFRNINFFTFVIIILIFRLDSWRACASENIDMKPVSHVIIKPAQVETPPSPIFDPRKFGATGDGVTFDTAAIQKAIDACAGTGGSVVFTNLKPTTTPISLRVPNSVLSRLKAQSHKRGMAYQSYIKSILSNQVDNS